MTEGIEPTSRTAATKRDADYVFYELTRSICPQCRRVIDAHILLRNNKVYMRKRCPEHGRFAGLAQAGQTLGTERRSRCSESHGLVC